MRVLVTGGAGFIGSHVVGAYLQAGHEVWAMDDLSRGKRDRIHSGATFVRMDLRSPEVKRVLAEGRFDCVNHHAAQIDVRASVADPMRDAAVNIVGSLNLLEAMRAVGTPRLIFASTGGAIYGQQRQFPAAEQHPTAPLSPYGVTKLSVEHYLEYYRQVHGLAYVVLRYANVYGPRQDPEGEAGVVAIFSGRILRGQPLFIYGDGEQTRDYVYVEDVARASVLALQHLQDGGPAQADVPAGAVSAEGPAQDHDRPVYNIGTGVETSVNALAALLLEGADADCPVLHRPARLGEQPRSVIDPARARAVLGWEPQVPVSDGLMATLAWFRAHQPVEVPV
jgi:UDP-glucose 4-epimerase